MIDIVSYYVVPWWTRNAGIVNSIPPCVPFITLFVRKATGNHLMNSTTLEKSQSLVSGFYYARDRICNGVYNDSVH